MERCPKDWCLPEFRGREHQTRPSTLFSPVFSLAREKIGPPEARQKRPRRNEPPQATSLILCARFFLSKPQTEFAVWVFMQICNSNPSVAFGASSLYTREPWGAREKSLPFVGRRRKGLDGMLFCRGLLQKILNIIRLGRQRVGQLDQLWHKAAALVDVDGRRFQKRRILRRADGKTE